MKLRAKVKDQFFLITINSDLHCKDLKASIENSYCSVFPESPPLICKFIKDSHGSILHDGLLISDVLENNDSVEVNEMEHIQSENVQISSFQQWPLERLLLFYRSWQHVLLNSILNSNEINVNSPLINDNNNEGNNNNLDGISLYSLLSEFALAQDSSIHAHTLRILSNSSLLRQNKPEEALAVIAIILNQALILSSNNKVSPDIILEGLNAILYIIVGNRSLHIDVMDLTISGPILNALSSNNIHRILLQLLQNNDNLPKNIFDRAKIVISITNRALSHNDSHNENTIQEKSHIAQLRYQYHQHRQHYNNNNNTNNNNSNNELILHPPNEKINENNSIPSSIAAIIGINKVNQESGIFSIQEILPLLDSTELQSQHFGLLELRNHFPDIKTINSMNPINDDNNDDTNDNYDENNDNHSNNNSRTNTSLPNNTNRNNKPDKVRKQIRLARILSSSLPYLCLLLTNIVKQELLYFIDLIQSPIMSNINHDIINHDNNYINKNNFEYNLNENTHHLLINYNNNNNNDHNNRNIRHNLLLKNDLLELAKHDKEISMHREILELSLEFLLQIIRHFPPQKKKKNKKKLLNELNNENKNDENNNENNNHTDSYISCFSSFCQLNLLPFNEIKKSTSSLIYLISKYCRLEKNIMPIKIGIDIIHYGTKPLPQIISKWLSLISVELSFSSSSYNILLSYNNNNNSNNNLNQDDDSGSGVLYPFIPNLIIGSNGSWHRAGIRYYLLTCLANISVKAIYRNELIDYGGLDLFLSILTETKQHNNNTYNRRNRRRNDSNNEIFEYDNDEDLIYDDLEDMKLICMKGLSHLSSININYKKNIQKHLKEYQKENLIPFEDDIVKFYYELIFENNLHDNN